MAGPLATIAPGEYGNALLRGVLLINVPTAEQNPEGYLSIMTGASAGAGRYLANLAEAPSMSETDTRVNPFESLYGKTADVVGEEQIQSTRVEVMASLTSLSLENMKLLRPDFDFEVVMSTDATPVAVGVRMKRTLVLNISDYLDNIVLCASTSTHTIGRAIILRNAINVNEDREYSFNDDLEVFGVEATFRAHSDATSMDPETGIILPAVEEVDYVNTTIPA